MSDLSDGVGVGFGGRVRFGYEYMFGRIGVTPSIALELASFGAKNDVSASVFYLGVQPGVTAAVHLGMVAPYLGVTLGFDHYALTGSVADNLQAGGYTTDANGFGLGILLGLDFVFTPSVSVGIGGEIHPGFTSVDPGNGAQSQSLGHAALLFEGKYHF
jgi:opacity protein-like surface antigen